MAHNEADLLPFWLAHYAQQVGLADCYVLDHGSTDGSTQQLACHVVQLPREEHDRFSEADRARLVSDFCSNLLSDYAAVLYTDADELVFADPAIAPTLASYAATIPGRDIVVMLGMDLVQDEEREGPLDPRRPVLSQRQWVWATQSLCKPTLIRKPHQWALGFHLATEQAAPAGLYLFHLAYADMTITRRRQAKRNASLPKDGGDHHRLSPDEMSDLLRRAVPWDRRIDVELGGCPTEVDFISRLLPFGTAQEPTLWRIPQRFRKN